MPVRLIALDCATELLHLALVDGEATLTRSLPGGAQASVQLLPALRDLLAEAGLRWADVDALAFGRGPGAFTGLRTACAVVQGLAVATGRPLIALDTLEAVAESAFRMGAPAALWSVLDARMGECYAAAWEREQADAAQPSRWRCVHEPALYPQDGLPLTTPPREGRAVAWAGTGLRVAGAAAAASPWAAACPDGPALAVLARAAFAQGQLLDASAGLPLYVRDKVAQTMAERQARDSAAS